MYLDGRPAFSPGAFQRLGADQAHSVPDGDASESIAVVVSKFHRDGAATTIAA